MAINDDLTAHLLDPSRLAALRAVALLDTPTEEAFDRLSRLAALFLDAPVALVSLVDADRQFFKSCIGLPEPWSIKRETPLSHSFCQHNRDADNPLIIEDARKYPLVKDNLAIVDLNVIAYLGIPLVTSDGYVLGSFCVIDSKPRKWTSVEVNVIKDLAAAVMTEIQLRTEIAARTEAEGDRDNLAQLNKRLRQEMNARKQAEERQHHLELQLYQSQKMEAIGRLSGGMAHDLNNLLTPILGYSELLSEDPGISSDQKESLSEIMNSGIRARDLVKQLLAFSRKQMLELVPLNINEIINNFSKLLHRTIPENIAIKIHLSNDIQPVLADVNQIEQIIMNLAVNAAAAMPDGGELTIETKMKELDSDYVSTHLDVHPGSYVMLAVSDTGYGMSKETCDHIFEPFYSTKGEKGTGLGLATVFGVVKQHEGNIWLNSEPNKGTTFKVFLPTTVNMPASDNVVVNTSSDIKGTETILLVEDDERVRNLTIAILQQYGYTVVSAKDGNDALRELTLYQGNINLLLTDVIMPGMNGKELYKKALEEHPDLKVLYMSGYTNDIINHQGALDRGIHFIQKPFLSKDLARKIRAVFNE